MKKILIVGLFGVVLSFGGTTPSAASGLIMKTADAESKSGGAEAAGMKGKACKQILNILTGKYDDLDCKNKPDDDKCKKLKKAIDSKEKQCGDKK